MLNRDKTLDPYADHVFDLVKANIDYVDASSNGSFFKLNLLFGDLVIAIYDRDYVIVNGVKIKTEKDVDGYGIIYNYVKDHLAEIERNREEHNKKITKMLIEKAISNLKTKEV